MNHAPLPRILLDMRKLVIRNLPKFRYSYLVKELFLTAT